MTDIINVTEMKRVLQVFAKMREWEKFHSPKNLSMALAGETGELVEIFQWMTEQESLDVKNQPDTKERVSQEVADILLYLIRLADRLDIDLNIALYDKMVINEKKYPVQQVKGSAKKYHHYCSSEK